MHCDIVVAGFGGQGILFAGKVLAYLGLLKDKEVSWLPSYGPEMRGGTANCSVCINDEPIGFPQVNHPNMLIAMNQPSYEKFIDKVTTGGTVVVDSTMVLNKCDRNDVNAFYIPATQLALDNNVDGMANIILLGKLISETKIADYDEMKKAIRKTVPSNRANLIEANIKAFEIGAYQ
ncbi:MAG: 2-oxoacid:acceptor oxidoreductase family protein [Ruminococcus sp.]|nr:2-oxoacid:acceptor oxidoreductase family protein [Ruminococcus sp.]